MRSPGLLSRPEEFQKFGIDLILVRGRDAMRCSEIVDFLRRLDELCRLRWPTMVICTCVAENRGVLRNALVVVQDGKVGVAQTAMFDSDLNVL